MCIHKCCFAIPGLTLIVLRMIWFKIQKIWKQVICKSFATMMVNDLLIVTIVVLAQAIKYSLTHQITLEGLSGGGDIWFSLNKNSLIITREVLILTLSTRIFISDTSLCRVGLIMREWSYTASSREGCNTSGKVWYFAGTDPV